MKNLIFVVLTCLVCISCSSQEKETIYVYFDSNSQETFTEEYDRQKLELKKYRMSILNDKDIEFKILRELFFYDKSEALVKNATREEYKEMNFSSIDYMHQEWKKSNLFSSQKVFNKIFLVKPTENSKVFKVYEVVWMQYVR